MKVTAKDIMYTRFHTLQPHIPISEAVKLFRKAGEEEKRKIFG
jgi:hypothetical protein